MKEYQASLAQQGQDLMKDLNDKDSLFVRDSAKLSPSMKEIKKNELVGLYQRVQNWNQQAQEMYQAEAQKRSPRYVKKSYGCHPQRGQREWIRLCS